MSTNVSSKAHSLLVGDTVKNDKEAAMIELIVIMACVMMSLLVYRVAFPKKRMFREIDFNYRPSIGRK